MFRKVKERNLDIVYPLYNENLTIVNLVNNFRKLYGLKCKFQPIKNLEINNFKLILIIIDGLSYFDFVKIVKYQQYFHQQQYQH